MWRTLFRTTFAASLLLLTTVSASLFAQPMRSEMVVSTDWLARHHDYASSWISDGGYTKWMNEGRALQQGVCTTEPLMFHARLNSSAVASMKVTRDIIKWRNVLGSSYVLIDSRPDKQFQGPGRDPRSAPGPYPGSRERSVDGKRHARGRLAPPAGSRTARNRPARRGA